MPAEVVAQRVALALQGLRQRPGVAFGQVDVDVGRAGRVAEHVHHACIAVLRDLVGGLQHFRQLQHQRGAILRQCVHRAGMDQRFQRALVEAGGIHPLAEIQQVGERSVGRARSHDRLAGALAYALHRAQAVADRLWLGRLEHVGRGVDVRRQHREAQRPRLVEEADHLVGVVHVRGQHRGHELRRVVHLQPRGLVGDQRVRRRVRLVEAVLGELLHQVEDLRRRARVHAAFGGAGLELGAFLRHFLGLLLAHRATQQVGAAQRIAGQDLGDLHHLFLVHDHAIGRRQHRFQRGMRIAHRGDAVLAVAPFAVHPAAQRAGAEQRGQRDDVFEAVRLRPLQQFPHAARFELEHRHRIAAREQRVGRRVVQRQGGDVECRLAGHGAADVDRLHRPVDDGQRTQAEEVELHQADRFDVVLVELGHRVAAQAVAIVFREQRAEVRQRAGRDHHAAGVLAGVAGQVFQLQGEVDQVADVVLGLVAFLEFADDAVGLLARARADADRVFQRHRIGGLQRDQLGQAVHEAVRETEHAADVAQHRLRGHGAVGDDLADPVAAVLAGDVVDDLVAPIHAEVDVEVGHRHAFRVEEALEQQVVRQRVEVGDAERPRHQ